MKEFTANENFLSPEYQKGDFLVQILAGGKGTRLASVTLGLTPKSLIEIAPNLTALDLTVQKVQSLGFTKLVYSLGLQNGCFGKEIYEHIKNKGYGLESVFEKHNRGNAYSVKKMAELTNCKFPLLVLCSDMLLPWNTLSNAAFMHKKGTFTWITSSKYMPAMEKYYGLKVRSDGAVIYDTSLTPEGKSLDDGNLKTVSKGGSIIVDPELFIESMNEIESTNKLNSSTEKTVDIFWDVIPLIEKQNQLRILNGEKSILNAVIGDEPVMDIGTPETLDLVRKYLNNQK